MKSVGEGEDYWSLNILVTCGVQENFGYMQVKSVWTEKERINIES